MKYQVASSTTIHEPLKNVVPYIVDFEKWPQWSPWSVCEPNHQKTVSGQKGKPSHTMNWAGEIIGSGQIRIQEVQDHEIHYDLQFLAPWKSQAKTSFILEKINQTSTKITWTMDSSMPFFLFFLVGIIKSSIEMDYDRGLAMLKEVVETGKVQAKSTNEGIVSFSGFSYVGIKRTCHMDQMPIHMKDDFTQLMSDPQIQAKNAEKWITVYPHVNMKTKMFTYIAACSDEQLSETPLSGEYVSGTIPSGNMLKIHHEGSYRFLGNAWSMGMMYLRAKKIKQGGKPFELYLNSPQNTAEQDLQTDIYFPVR